MLLAVLTATDITSIAVQERVTGTGIPAGSFVGAITIGSPTSSFTLVNEAGTALNATANGNQTL
jgi:hypothetical protein